MEESYHADGTEERWRRDRTEKSLYSDCTEESWHGNLSSATSCAKMIVNMSIVTR
jgi:hypothetical protein